LLGNPGKERVRRDLVIALSVARNANRTQIDKELKGSKPLFLPFFLGLQKRIECKSTELPRKQQYIGARGREKNKYI